MTYVLLVLLLGVFAFSWLMLRTVDIEDHGALETSDHLAKVLSHLDGYREPIGDHERSRLFETGLYIGRLVLRSGRVWSVDSIFWLVWFALKLLVVIVLGLPGLRRFSGASNLESIRILGRIGLRLVSKPH